MEAIIDYVVKAMVALILGYIGLKERKEWKGRKNGDELSPNPERCRDAMNRISILEESFRVMTREVGQVIVRQEDIKDRLDKIEAKL